MKILKKMVIIMLALIGIINYGYCEDFRSEQVFIAVTNPQYSDFNGNAEGTWNAITGSDSRYEITDTSVSDLTDATMSSIKSQLDAQYGEGNYEIDMEAAAQYAICGNNAEDVLLTIKIKDNKEPVPPVPSISEYVEINSLHKYDRKAREHMTNLEEDLKAMLIPDKNNLSGKVKLYSLGDEISLTAAACTHVMRDYRYYYKEDIEVIKYEERPIVRNGEFVYDSNGKRVTEKVEVDRYRTSRDINEEVPGSSSFTKTTFPINIKFEGFKVCDGEKNNIQGATFAGGQLKKEDIYIKKGLNNNSSEIENNNSSLNNILNDILEFLFGANTSSNHKKDIIKNDESLNEQMLLEKRKELFNEIKERKGLSTPTLKITEIDNTLYDENKGLFYGKITVSCNCCQGGHSQSFDLYFGEIPENEPVDLTVKVTPKSAGTAKVTAIMDQNSNGIIEESEKNKKTISITDEKTIGVLPNSICTIESIDGVGYKYQYILTPDGNIITTKNPYDHTIYKTSEKLIVHFTPIKEEGYTLYVDSNIGGRAWTDTRPEGTIYSEFKNDQNIKIGDKISKVQPGTKFELKYEAKEGYEFDRWEYRPFVGERVEIDSTSIYMPYSDLTATAIFKKIPIEKEPSQKPILKVISNNEEWGTAYAMVNGIPVNLSNVDPGIDYEVIHEAKEGYYFTNWEYDSINSPFKDADKGIITMPNYDLEVIAFFAPIPTEDELGRGKNVKFVAETLTPEDGIIPGTVPDDLTNIAAGAQVTFGVTANIGYEFVKWYFTKENTTEEICPDNFWNAYGTGMFLMPDYDIKAHAVFKKIDPVNLTVIIKGINNANGKVSANGKDIPSGSVVTVSRGDKVELIATPNSESKFLCWVGEDKKIISRDEKISYLVDKDKVIFAYFRDKHKHTLYVTSMNGGNANPILTEEQKTRYNINKQDVGLGKIMYTIKDVWEDEKIEIAYKTEEGYKFSKWEYKPYIKAINDNRYKDWGTSQISMPDSDLTVTAIFKDDRVSLDPKLRVTSNNINWGSAWTVINGKDTDMDKEYDAIVGEKYTVYYKAKPGYYFVNWQYSTSKSPFIEANNIKMPDKNLEVMGMFSPIPDKPIIPDDIVDERQGHAIDFIAEPTEGGNIPEDLTDIFVDSKVTIGVTPNFGWKFAYWYFKDEAGNRVELKKEYDPDGSGYFIMPDYNVKAIAVFKRVGTYKLYVTYTRGGTAKVIDSNGLQVQQISDAIPEELYDLRYEVQDGYKFVGWEFRWDKYNPNGESEGINPILYDKNNNKGLPTTDKALMPYSDMTVTAKFERIDNNGPYTLRVISNNYIWGDARIKVNGVYESWIDSNTNPLPNNSKAAIVINPADEYEIEYEANDGYIYTNTLPIDWIVKWPDANKLKKDILKIKVPENIKSDVDIVVYFKPTPAENKFYLTVKTDPEDSGIVSGSGEYLENSEFKINVVESYEGYKFKCWYYIKDGEKIIVANNKKYTGIMPDYDLTMIAEFEKDGTGPVPPPVDENKYKIVVKIDGEGIVKDIYENIITEKEMKDGESITLNAIPNTNYQFDRWTIKGKTVANNEEATFTIDGETIVVTAHFSEITKSTCDSFKIISVRDLRWKDYFVQGSALTGNVFNIPTDNSTMLKQVNDYPEMLKMGYAVEFELVTSQLKREKTVLVIKPRIFNSDGAEIPWSEITDELKGEKISKSNRFWKDIVICGNKNDNNDTKIYQTKVKYIDEFNNGVNLNKIKWNWIYYLPAKISFSGYNSNSYITVRFDIQIHETVDGKTYSESTLREKLVLFEKIYGGSQWEGDVYKYSLGQSLLDDIYDNSQN